MEENLPCLILLFPFVNFRRNSRIFSHGCTIGKIRKIRKIRRNFARFKKNRPRFPAILLETTTISGRILKYNRNQTILCVTPCIKL